MELWLSRGGCDTERQCPALRCSAWLPLIHFLHVLLLPSAPFIPDAGICPTQAVMYLSLIQEQG